MLLFLLACGLAVTLGLMNFVNLAHGVFAMGGGYVTALMMNRAGVPFLATLPFAFIVPALVGVVRRAAALPPALWREPARPGAVDRSAWCSWRSPLSNIFSATSRSRSICPLSFRAASSFPGVAIGVYRLFLIGVCGVDRGDAAGLPRQHPLRRAIARRGRRPPRRRGARDRRRAAVRRHLCDRQRPRRARRRARRRRGRRHRSELSDQVHGLVPDRRGDRRLARDRSAPFSARCCSACSTSPANITSPRSAPSSSMR